MKYRIASVPIGLLLLIVAGLKVYGLSVSPVPSVWWLSSPLVQIGVAEWELVLGIWLLSNKCPIGSWLAALSTFAVFAGVSGYLGWIGQAHCGCFGSIEASPWLAFAVDLAALVLLAISRPNSLARSLRPSLRSLSVPVGAAIFLIAVTGIATAIYGSPTAAIARMRGETLTISSDYVDFGSGSAEHKLETTIEIRNWSDKPIRIIGGTSDCSCVTTADLPLTIPPGDMRHANVRLKIPANSGTGTFTRLAELWTDDANQPRIPLRIGCRVVE